MKSLTKRGWALAFSSLTLLGLGMATGDPLLYFSGLAGLTIVVYYHARASRYERVLEALEIARPSKLVKTAAGGRTLMSFNISNPRGQGVERMIVTDTPPPRVRPEGRARIELSISGGESVVASYQARPAVGRSVWDTVEVAAVDPLGVSVAWRHVKLPAAVEAYPVVPREEMASIVSPWGLGRPMKVPTQGSLEFLELREYVEGDDPRSIYWPATARHQTLIVKDTAVESRSSVHVVVDYSEEMWVGTPGQAPIDHAALLSTAIVEAAAATGGLAGFTLFDGYDCRVYRQGSAREAAGLLREALSTLSPQVSRSVDRLLTCVGSASGSSAGSILVVVTGPGATWNTLLARLREYLSAEHPAIAVAIALPRGEGELDRLVSVREARLIDEALRTLGPLPYAVAYGGYEELAARVAEVMYRWG